MFLDERMCHSERSEAKSKNLLLMSALSLLLLSGCTLYDNYDIDLMEGGDASIESSSAEELVESSCSAEEMVESSSSAEEKDVSCDGMERGGVDYATVVIHENCWMAENLNYEPAAGHSKCFDDDPANCESYGRLYDYPAAEQACPTGWRLPTSADYIDLQNYSASPEDEAGAHFKTTTGWIGENGDNKLKFSALPGGFCDSGDCLFVGKVGYWWTKTESVMGEHMSLYLSGDRQDFSASLPQDDESFLSVRCIKDK